MLFVHANVSDEVIKYTKILDSLQKNHAVFPKITDILQNIPHDHRYFSLKASLLEKFSSTTRDNVSALLHTFPRCDDSVLDYFQRLKTTLSDVFEPKSNFETELLRHCLLNFVDVDVRMTPTLSTLVGKACCDLRNFLRSFARLHKLRVLEEGNSVATSNTHHKKKVANNTWLYIRIAIYV